MSGHQASRIAKQWIQHAEEDLRLARHAFKLKSAVPYKLIAFHAQQCAEKYLKAYLTLKKIEIPHTHNISYLIELLSPLAEWIQDFEDAKTLTYYAVTTRYPGKDRVRKKDAIQAVEIADRLRRAVRRQLRKEGVVL